MPGEISSTQPSIRRWRFTINSRGEPIEEGIFRSWGCNYVVYQEHIDENQCVYIEGYCEMPTAMARGELESRIGGSYFRRARGDRGYAYSQCVDPENACGDPHEFGNVIWDVDGYCYECLSDSEDDSYMYTDDDSGDDSASTVEY